MMILSDLVISDAQEGRQGALPAPKVVSESNGFIKKETVRLRGK